MGDFAPGHLRGDLRLSCTWQWDTPCVHDTVTVKTRVPLRWRPLFGSREQVNARAWESVRSCDEMRTAIFLALITLPTDQAVCRRVHAHVPHAHQWRCPGPRSGGFL